MTVWPAHEVNAGRPLPAPTIASTSTLTTSGGDGSEAMVDQMMPRSSHDPKTPYFHWWPKKGTTEWVYLDFKNEETVRRVGVYWFDDTGTGECRVPVGWKVLYRRGEEWVPVAPTSAYGMLKDRSNDVDFLPVKTTAIKLEVQLQPGWSAGIYEVSVQ